MLRFQEKYKKEVIPAMIEKFGYKNAMVVPKVEKAVLNTGFGKLISGKTSEEQKKIIDCIEEDLSLIAGQKAITTRARKPISGFKLRKGMPVGAKITLRGQKMNEFLERLIHIALPRSRDFNGIEPSSFDQKGNLTIAIEEQTTFPEVALEKTRFIFGFAITVVTTAKTREEGLELLKSLGFPIKSS